MPEVTVVFARMRRPMSPAVFFAKAVHLIVLRFKGIATPSGGGLEPRRGSKYPIPSVCMVTKVIVWFFAPCHLIIDSATRKVRLLEGSYGLSRSGCTSPIAYGHGAGRRCERAYALRAFDIALFSIMWLLLINHRI